MRDALLEYVQTSKELCYSCGESPHVGALFCDDCRERLVFVDGTHDIDGRMCRYPLFYNNAFRGLLKRFKFRGETSLVEPFAKFLVAHLEEKGMLADVRWIAFVPMSAKREAMRGYNQAKLLAQEIERLTGLDVVHLLRKSRQTREQNKISRVDRVTNLRDSFAFDLDRSGRVLVEHPSLHIAKRIPLEHLRGQKGLLIDDFVTTGATFRECKKQLDAMDLDVQYAAVASSHFPEDGGRIRDV